MSILKSMWPFSSPAPKSITGDAQTEKTPSQSQPQTPAKRATPRPQQYPITTNLQPGTPEARCAAAGLRRQAQSMILRAEEIQSERSGKKVRVSTGRRTTRTSSTSGIQRPSSSYKACQGTRRIYWGTKTPSGGVRTRTAPTPTPDTTRPRSRSVRAHSCRPDVPFSSSSVPRTASTTASAQPLSPTDTLHTAPCTTEAQSPCPTDATEPLCLFCVLSRKTLASSNHH